MKRFVRILITTIFLLFGFISCSLFTNEEESSVTITFNGADLARSAERTMTLPSDSNDYYLVASILGDYKEAKMIPFSSLGTYTVRFNSVPIGAEIYVEANAYNPNVQVMPGADMPSFVQIATGSSSKKRILSGTNPISLQMKKITTNNINTINTISTQADANEIMYNGYQIWSQAFTLNFYSNGKYQITNNDGTIISEGLYSGLPEVGNTVVFTEYVFSELIVDEGDAPNGGVDVTFGKLVIVEEPQSTSIYMGDEICTFYFETGSNIEIFFMNHV